MRALENKRKALVEAAGIEPASEGTTLMLLHV